MIRFILTFLIISIICSQSLSAQLFRKSKTLDICEYEKKSAQDDVDNGKYYLVINFGFGGNLPRYEEELKLVLKQNNIILKVNPISCVIENDGVCYKNFMDSVLLSRYGANFITEVHKKADSIYISNRNNQIFESWEIDERPHLSQDSTNMFGDYFIDYLNSKIDSSSNYLYYSNCVGSTHFKIEFVIDSIGQVLNCEILQEEFIYNETEVFKEQLKQELISLVNSMDMWIPAKLGPYNVNSVYRRGTAIKYK